VFVGVYYKDPIPRVAKRIEIFPFAHEGVLPARLKSKNGTDFTDGVLY
jgi:hypothetical protein